MSQYRDALPQLSEELFITDGGLETTLIFHEGYDLPEFAAYTLLDSESGCDSLRNYFRQYANVAKKHQVGFILESMTYRASMDWGKKLEHTAEKIRDMNRQGIELLQGIREEFGDVIPHIVISGCMGPRGDGYQGNITMTPDEAEYYHHTQIATLAETDADMVTAFTIPYITEAIGIANAAKAESIPVVIGFTVETDGRLPSGELLSDAITQVDAATDNYPAYYMINCAYPTHFASILNGADWPQRIRAVRANASAKSHAELDESTELDAGDPQALGALYHNLKGKLENLNVLGGCCGTDPRHISEMCRAVSNVV